jgi:hypothetical protein
MHKWQDAHPGEVKKPTAPPEVPTEAPEPDQGGTIFFWIFIAAAIGLATYALVAIGRRRSRQNAEYASDIPTVKLSAPGQLRDELRDLLNARSRIHETDIQNTITQIVQDTQVVFEKLQANLPNEVDTTVVEYEAYLRDLLEVIKVYEDIQNRPRYYDDPEGSKQDGRDAINGFGEFVLTSARRAGRKNLTKFNVNTKILSARRYA